MEATTKISKEEFLDKLEKAKKELYNAPHCAKQYLLSEQFLKKVFEIAEQAIPIKWVERYIKHKVEITGITEEVLYINDMLRTWEEETWPK